MSDITIQPGQYFFQYMLAVRSTVPSNATGWATELRSGQPQGFFYTDVHPQTVENAVGFTRNTLIAFVVRLSAPVPLSEIDRQAIAAYQRGVDHGISVTGLVASLQASNPAVISANPFAPYQSIRREYHAASGTASAEPELTALQRLVASQVSDSNRSTEVGQPTPPVFSTDGASDILNRLRDFLDIGTTYKIAAVAVVGVIGFAMVGYGIRSIK